MKIVFDLDGVLRDLNGYLHDKFEIPYPKEWFWKYQGKDIFAWVKEDDYRPLVYAKTMPYYFLVKHCFEDIEIWTNQPEDWKEKTKLWLDVHFTNYNIKYEVKYMTNAEKRVELDRQPDTWLVEDSPLFTSWDRIFLIDHPYNKYIQDAIRIYNLEDLDHWIWRMLKTNEVSV